jgi:hypothetical protein
VAHVGSVDVTVRVDARRVIDVVQAIDMLTRLLDDRYGHEWTDDEGATLEKAVAACDRKNLAAEAP